MLLIGRLHRNLADLAARDRGQAPGLSGFYLVHLLHGQGGTVLAKIRCFIARLSSTLETARQGGYNGASLPPSEHPCVNLREVILQPVASAEEARFQALMQAHHSLGALPKIRHTLWFVATRQGQWLALLSFSAAAWKCAARDAWIGWDFRQQ